MSDLVLVLRGGSGSLLGKIQACREYLKTIGVESDTKLQLILDWSCRTISSLLLKSEAELTSAEDLFYLLGEAVSAGSKVGISSVLLTSALQAYPSILNGKHRSSPGWTRAIETAILYSLVAVVHNPSVSRYLLSNSLLVVSLLDAVLEVGAGSIQGREGKDLQSLLDASTMLIEFYTQSCRSAVSKRKAGLLCCEKFLRPITMMLQHLDPSECCGAFGRSTRTMLGMVLFTREFYKEFETYSGRTAEKTIGVDRSLVSSFVDSLTVGKEGSREEPVRCLVPSVLPWILELFCDGHPVPEATEKLTQFRFFELLESTLSYADQMDLDSVASLLFVVHKRDLYQGHADLQHGVQQLDKLRMIVHNLLSSNTSFSCGNGSVMKGCYHAVSITQKTVEPHLQDLLSILLKGYTQFVSEAENLVMILLATYSSIHKIEFLLDQVWGVVEETHIPGVARFLQPKLKDVAHLWGLHAAIGVSHNFFDKIRTPSWSEETGLNCAQPAEVIRSLVELGTSVLSGVTIVSPGCSLADRDVKLLLQHLNQVAELHQQLVNVACDAFTNSRTSVERDDDSADRTGDPVPQHLHHLVSSALLLLILHNDISMFCTLSRLETAQAGLIHLNWQQTPWGLYPSFGWDWSALRMHKDVMYQLGWLLLQVIRHESYSKQEVKESVVLSTLGLVTDLVEPEDADHTKLQLVMPWEVNETTTGHHLQLMLSHHLPVIQSWLSSKASRRFFMTTSWDERKIRWAFQRPELYNLTSFQQALTSMLIKELQVAAQAVSPESTMMHLALKGLYRRAHKVHQLASLRKTGLVLSEFINGHEGLKCGFERRSLDVLVLFCKRVSALPLVWLNQNSRVVIIVGCLVLLLWVLQLRQLKMLSGPVKAFTNILRLLLESASLAQQRNSLKKLDMDLLVRNLYKYCPELEEIARQDGELKGAQKEISTLLEQLIYLALTSSKRPGTALYDFTLCLAKEVMIAPSSSCTHCHLVMIRIFVMQASMAAGDKGKSTPQLSTYRLGIQLLTSTDWVHSLDSRSFTEVLSILSCLLETAAKLESSDLKDFHAVEGNLHTVLDRACHPVEAVDTEGDDELPYHSLIARTKFLASLCMMEDFLPPENLHEKVVRPLCHLLISILGRCPNPEDASDMSHLIVSRLARRRSLAIGEVLLATCVKVMENQTSDGEVMGCLRFTTSILSFKLPVYTSKELRQLIVQALQLSSLFLVPKGGSLSSHLALAVLDLFKQALELRLSSLECTVVSLALSCCLLTSNVLQSSERVFSANCRVIDAIILRHPNLCYQMVHVVRPCVLNLITCVVSTNAELEKQRLGVSPQGSDDVVRREAEHVARIYKDLGSVGAIYKHVPYLLADYLSTCGAHSLPSNVQVLMENGLYSLLDICTEFEVSFMNSNLQKGQRELFRRIYQDFRKFYMFKGK